MKIETKTTTWEIGWGIKNNIERTAFMIVCLLAGILILFAGLYGGETRWTTANYIWILTGGIFMVFLAIAYPWPPKNTSKKTTE